MCLTWRPRSSAVSKPAVSRVSNPQTLRRLQSLGTGDGSADWKSAIRQVWKPALRPKALNRCRRLRYVWHKLQGVRQAARPGRNQNRRYAPDFFGMSQACGFHTLTKGRISSFLQRELHARSENASRRIFEVPGFIRVFL